MIDPCNGGVFDVKCLSNMREKGLLRCVEFGRGFEHLPHYLCYSSFLNVWFHIDDSE